MLTQKYTIVWKDPEMRSTELYAHHIEGSLEEGYLKFFGDPEGLAGMAHEPFATITDTSIIRELTVIDVTA